MSVERVAGWLRRVPGVALLVRRVRGGLSVATGGGAAQSGAFPGSAAYWRERYAAGANSGPGSYGKFAVFKAKVLNALFAEQAIGSAIEFGSGDGNQLALLAVPEYLGVDISPEAIALCRERFAGVPGRRFVLADRYDGERAECSLSLDVIYHLVEDTAFEAYMRQLFAAATRLVVVYSSDREGSAADGDHVRHRRFTEWVRLHEPGWRLWRHVANEHPYKGDYRTGSFADFYCFVPAALPSPAA